MPPAPGVEAYHGLDQAEAGGLAGPDHVAAERDLEPGGEAEAVDEGERRQRQRLDPPHGAEQGLEAEIGAVAARVDDLLEDVDVGAAREQLALGAPDERPGV